MPPLVSIARAPHRPEEHENWIYLGHRFDRLLDCNGNLANRIDLGPYMATTRSQSQQAFLRWNSKSRIAARGALGWWLNHVAGRNNLVSQVPAAFNQLAALALWHQTADVHRSVIVVCEDEYLVQAAHAALGLKLTPVRSMSSWLRRVADEVQATTHSLLGTAVVAARILRRRRHYRAKGFGPRSWHGKGSVTLVLQCLNASNLTPERPLRDNYFRELPELLANKGVSTHRILWVFDSAAPAKLVTRASDKTTDLLPEAWISLSDLCRAAFVTARRHRYIRISLDRDVPGGDWILRRERVLSRRSSYGEVLFAAWPEFARRVAARVSDLTLLSTFEMTPSENTLPPAFRESLGNRFTHIGFAHAIVSRDYLGYHTERSEWSENIYPDRIVTCGPGWKRSLESLGHDPKRLVAGPSVRQSLIVGKRETGFRPIPYILVLFPLMPNAIQELVGALTLARIADLAAGFFRFGLRPHPMSSPEIVLESFGWSQLPPGVSWATEPLAAEISRCDVGIVMSSASAVDLVIAETPVCIVSRVLDSSWSYLDSFEPLPDSMLPIRLDALAEWLEKWCGPHTAQLRTEVAALSEEVRRAFGEPLPGELAVWLPIGLATRAVPGIEAE
jgi:hypothetical protein